MVLSCCGFGIFGSCVICVCSVLLSRLDDFSYCDCLCSVFNVCWICNVWLVVWCCCEVMRFICCVCWFKVVDSLWLILNCVMIFFGKLVLFFVSNLVFFSVCFVLSWCWLFNWLCKVCKYVFSCWFFFFVSFECKCVNFWWLLVDSCVSFSLLMSVFRCVELDCNVKFCVWLSGVLLVSVFRWCLILFNWWWVLVCCCGSWFSELVILWVCFCFCWVWWFLFSNWLLIWRIFWFSVLVDIFGDMLCGLLCMLFNCVCRVVESFG